MALLSGGRLENGDNEPLRALGRPRGSHGGGNVIITVVSQLCCACTGQLPYGQPAAGSRPSSKRIARVFRRLHRFWCCRSRRSPPWAPPKRRPADRGRQRPLAPLPAAAAAAPARRRSFLARCAAKGVHRVGVRVLRLLWADRALFGCCGCPGPAAVAPNGSAQPRLGGSTAGRAAARADAGLAASRPAATAVSCARAAVLAGYIHHRHP